MTGVFAVVEFDSASASSMQVAEAEAPGASVDVDRITRGRTVPEVDAVVQTARPLRKM